MRAGEQVDCFFDLFASGKRNFQRNKFRRTVKLACRQGNPCRFRQFGEFGRWLAHTVATREGEDFGLQ